MEEMEQEIQYATKVNMALATLFDEESGHYIDMNELAEDGKKLKAFIHAFANMSPCMLFNKITGQDQDLLQFNHTANSICFEFAKKEEEK